MSRSTAYWSADYDDFESFCDQVRRSVRGVRIISDADDDISEFMGEALTIPKQNWSRGSQPGKKMSFGDLYSHHLTLDVQSCFIEYPQGYLAFVASGGGEIKEIVFVRSGASYKRSEQEKAGISRMAEVVLLASHQSHAILRALRKIDSVITNATYRGATAPLDLAIFIEKEVRKARRPVKVVNI